MQRSFVELVVSRRAVKLKNILPLPQYLDWIEHRSAKLYKDGCSEIKERYTDSFTNASGVSSLNAFEQHPELTRVVRSDSDHSFFKKSTLSQFRSG